MVEKDLAGNTSNATTSISALVDRTAPNAPSLSYPNKQQQTATWTWTPGGGGSGSYQCQLDNGNVGTCTTTYTLSSPTDGDHTLKVRELDAANNPSAWASGTITIDLQKPVIAQTNHKSASSQVFNTIQPFTGSATDERGMRYVQYQVGSTGAWITASGTNPWTFTPALDTGTQTLTIRAEDIAGNQTAMTVQVTYEPNVVFVLKSAAGAGDGSSWADAYPELGPVLAANTTYPAGRKIWVSEGAYTTASTDGFLIKPNVLLNGGFANTGVDRSLASRDLSHHISTLNAALSSEVITAGGSTVYVDSVTVTDFQLAGGTYGTLSLSYTKKAFFQNITVKFQNLSGGSIFSIYESKVDILDSHFDYNTAVDGTISVNGNLRLRHTSVSVNTNSDGGGITANPGSTVCAGSTSSVSDNSSPDVAVYGGTFSYESGFTTDSGGISDGSTNVVGACPSPF